MGRASRQKGKRGERFFAAALRLIFGDQVRRGWQAREGADAPDIDGSPFWCESKVGQRIDYEGALRQAEDAADKAGDERPCVVLARRDRCRPVALMRLEDWLALVEELHASGYWGRE